MPKKTTAVTRQSGNHYILEAKGNQKSLFNQLRLNMENYSPINTYFTKEMNRGRLEIRKTYLYDNTSNIDSDWVDVKRIVKIIRTGIRDKKEYYEEHYFISSVETNDAALIAKAIRGHWGIENNLHYVKDVNMNEDKSGIKGGSSAENLSILKNMAINIYRCNGLKSIKSATKKYTNKIAEQMQLIRNTHILKI